MDLDNSAYVRYPGSQTTPGLPRPATPVRSLELTTRTFGLNARALGPTARAFCSTARAHDRDLRAQRVRLHEQIVMGSPEFIVAITLTLYIGPQLLNIVFAVLQILL